MGSGAIHGVMQVCEDEGESGLAKHVGNMKKDSVYDTLDIWKCIDEDLASTLEDRKFKKNKTVQAMQGIVDNLDRGKIKKLHTNIKMVKEASDKMEEAYQCYLDWVKPVHEMAFDGIEIKTEDGDQSEAGKEMVIKFERLLAEAIKCFDKDANDDFDPEEAGMFFTILVAANVDFEKKKTQQLNELYMSRLQAMADKFENKTIRDEMMRREKEAQEERAEEYETKMKDKLRKYTENKKQKDKEAVAECDQDGSGGCSIKELTRAITPYAGTNQAFFSAFGMPPAGAKKK